MTTPSFRPLHDCPFPDCMLPSEHDGDHKPAWRCIQRFHYDPTSLKANGPIHPGFCEAKGEGGCDGIAVALYGQRGRRAMAVCANCEAELPTIPGARA